jgi:hypothetical protein
MYRFVICQQNYIVIGDRQSCDRGLAVLRQILSPNKLYSVSRTHEVHQEFKHLPPASCKAASKLENFVPHKYENCYKLALHPINYT